MLREALIICSRRSWCLSSSLRNISNTERYGDCVVGVVGSPMVWVSSFSMDDGLIEESNMILSEGSVGRILLRIHISIYAPIITSGYQGAPRSCVLYFYFYLTVKTRESNIKYEPASSMDLSQRKTSERT